MAAGIAVLVVLTYLVGHLSGPALGRARWPHRHPAVAVALWVSALTGVVFVLLTLAILLLAWPPGPLHTAVEHLRSCLPGHSHTGELATAVVAVFSGGVIAWRSYRGMVRAGRRVIGRRRHHEMVTLIARLPEGPSDVCLIEHPVPLAYCLPGRSRPIVMTTGTLQELDAQQLAAVLEHERAHLRHRHHLLLAAVDILHTALPWVATVRHAKAKLPILIEMVADDAAARRHGPVSVIDSLLALCPQGDVRQRIARLQVATTERHPLLGAVAALLLTPLGGIALLAVGMHFAC